jgi:hypothetical protein
MYLMKYFIRFFLGIALLVFSTFATWYEGSELLDKPWEWEYSTHFSQMNGDVTNSNDISELDFFVYAVKYRPFYPILMMLSFLYVLLNFSYLLFRKNVRNYSLFLGIVGIISLIISTFISDSPTIGGKYFNLILNTLGIISLLNIAIYYLKQYLKAKKEVQPLK